MNNDIFKTKFTIFSFLTSAPGALISITFKNIIRVSLATKLFEKKKSHQNKIKIL
jgi:hypothetical protein